ncbi:CE1759 family FMN reductase [Kineococcus sp. SYSU DK001]|uniref:CE1759 family FMN reductase n=1 Tax=Kineococcus sp. SYSU DK001 TaxID=3383122 RepID=UPI003D7C729C
MSAGPILEPLPGGGGRRSLVVVSAGLRQPSSTRLLADRLGAATVQALREGGTEVDVTVVEVREHAHALVDALATGFASPALRAALDAVAGADGVVAVSPVFTGSYSGSFKSFFDVLEEGALAGTPVLLGATAGTARHSLALEHALRPLFAHLRTLTVPTGVFGATEDFGAGDAQTALARRVLRAGGELAALVRTRAPRPAGTDALPAPVTSFEQLLAGRP